MIGFINLLHLNNMLSIYYHRESIVRTVLMMLHKNINAKLFSFYEAYTILYLEINQMGDGRILFKPTYQKLVYWVEKMKKNC